jgi:hypothetical protein
MNTLATRTIPTLLVLLTASCRLGEADKDDSDQGPDETDAPLACDKPELPGEDVGVTEHCSEPVGGFEPVVEWSYGEGLGCLSQPLVVDVDGDGAPEVVFNQIDSGYDSGELMVLRGDGSGVLWRSSVDQLAFGSSPAAGDIDHDGKAEIVAVHAYGLSKVSLGEYSAVLYDDDGTALWESERVTREDFDFATAPIITDMDHDGQHEIVLGRVILDAATGATLGVGAHGHGSYGILTFGDTVFSEGSMPVVTDLDLDGVEEVIVGDAAYGPDGATLRHDPTQDDAVMAVANLDDDPEGELVAVTWNTIRAQDTDGSILWGPIALETAHLLSPPAIGDLDLDGQPEIVTAGGDQLVCLNHDGSTLWTASVTDQSGATGASIFDFEGDGLPEVVYIDEVEMVVFQGASGAVKFHSTEHASSTMFDYPTIADVDGDDQAEIVVCHYDHTAALSVYGDAEQRWKPARRIWNQHAYDIGNVEDDGTVPSSREYGFTTHNTWHSAIAIDGVGYEHDLEAEIREVCQDECDDGRLWVAVRLRNKGFVDTPEAIDMALYAREGDEQRLLTTLSIPAGVPSGASTDALWLEMDADEVMGADTLRIVADDDGGGNGAITECSETNNDFLAYGPFCDGPR